MYSSKYPLFTKIGTFGQIGDASSVARTALNPLCGWLKALAWPDAP